MIVGENKGETKAIVIKTGEDLLAVVKDLYRISRQTNADVLIENVEKCVEAMICAKALSPQIAYYILHDFLYFRRIAISRTLIEYCGLFNDLSLTHGGLMLKYLREILSYNEANEDCIIRALYLIKSLNFRYEERSYNVFRRVCSPIKMNKINNILDLGCGTGWAGKFYRDNGFAGLLTGVDLSKDMIEIASYCGYYNKLVNQNIVEYLSSCDTKYDLVSMMWVSAHLSKDTFISIVKSTHSVLRKSGYLIFDADIYKECSPALTANHGTYKISADDIQKTLRTIGFSVRYLDDHETRYYRCVTSLDGHLAHS